jgi:hypothetical protein
MLILKIQFIQISIKYGRALSPIVVGIGYMADRPMARERFRERDLLPTDASIRPGTRRQPATRTGLRRGQVSAFLRFIREEKRSMIP